MLSRKPASTPGDEVARHHAADDGIGEGEALAARHGLDLHLDIGELAVAARLPLMTGMLDDSLADGLAVRHLRRARLDH